MIVEFLLRYGYHGFLTIGAISMIVLTVWRRRRYALSGLQSFCFPMILLICGVSGAKLLYFIESGFTSFDGMSFFGAVYLVMLLMPVVGLRLGMKSLDALDACAPCVASIIGFMRFGCFCAGCCGGVLCSIGNRTFYWPTQLIEGFGDMIILLALLNYEQQTEKQGILYPVFLVTYGIMRFLIEFLRDTSKNLLGLSEGQWLSLVSILIGTVWIWVSGKLRRNNGDRT